jgi:hypothetical protein
MASLAVVTLGQSCGRTVVNERGKHVEVPNDGFSLVGKQCGSDFKFYEAEGSGMEITAPKVPPFDMALVSKELEGDGLKGEIHAAVPEFKTWVLNIYQGSFFNSYQFPLAIHDEKVLHDAMAVKRHDLVRIKGKILDNGAAQKHILVTEITVEKKYDSANFQPNYTHSQAVPDELKAGRSATVIVHSIAEDGKSVMVEYRDLVVQVVVANGELTKPLYRNDKIRIAYEAVDKPGRPLHLVLDEAAEKPIELVDRIADLHGKHATVTGCLVLFPKSPQITRNVYALLEVDENGLMRTWTMANFESMEMFNKITANFEDFWGGHSEEAVNFRNKMLNVGIKVQAKGLLNIAVPNQANPQILVDDVADITLTHETR